VILLLAALLGAPALAQSPTPDETFAETPGSLRGVSLSVQLRADSSLGDLEAALAAVTAAGGAATVIVTPELAEQESERLTAALKAGHEVALWMTAPADANRGMEGVDAWKRAGKAQLKVVRKATGRRPKTVMVDTLPRTGEVALDGLRFRTVLLDRTGRAHRIIDLSGIPGGLVVPAVGQGGPRPLDAATLDATARQLRGALDEGFPTINLPLALEAMDAEGAALLGRWLSEVIAPTGARVLSAKQIPLRATAALGESTPETEIVARPVDIADLESAAAEYVAATTLPRLTESGLNPTEVFLAFCLVLASPEPPERVLLDALSPPSEEVRSGLTRLGLTAPRDAVIDAASEIAPYLSYQVPNLVDVGETTLTAAEFVTAMAHAIQGTDPIPLVTPNNPDPYSDGLGWGASTGR